MSISQTDETASGIAPPFLGEGRRISQPQTEDRAFKIEDTHSQTMDIRNHSPDMKKSAPRISQVNRQSALDNYPSPLKKVNPRERHTSPDAVS